MTDIDLKMVQDKYLRPDEIDARNAARLMAILDKWEAGGYTHILHVLHDVYEIVQWVNPLTWHDFARAHPNDRSSMAENYLQRERDAFIPYIKPSFLKDLNSSDVRESLKAFKVRLDDCDGAMSSFEIAVLIFDSLSIDGDGGYDSSVIVDGEKKAREQTWGNAYMQWVNQYPNPFHRDIAHMREEAKELQAFTRKDSVLKFDMPEKEGGFRRRLERHVAELRSWCAEQGIDGHIISYFTADASGSVPFRPYVFNYNFLSDGPEKDALFAREAQSPTEFSEDRFFDFEEREFFPKHPFSKEYIYASPIVYVTSYGLTFYPQTPEDSDKVKKLLSEAFRILGEVEPRFGDPLYYSSAEPYKRPSGVFLPVQDRKIQPEERVDLDDLFNLYFLLEDFMKPSAAIAQTLNGAALAEGRSAIKTADMGDCGQSYDVSNSPKIDQIGGLEERRGDELGRGLKSIFELYALGQLDESGWVQQTMNMAELTLMGLLDGRPQALLTYEQMKGQAASEGRDVIPYDVALRDLTKVFMRVMVGLPTDAPNEMMANAAFQAVANQRDGLIAYLQAQDLRDFKAAREYAHRPGDFNSGDILGVIAKYEKDRAEALKLSDALSGYNPDYYVGNDQARAHALTVSTPHRVVVRDPEIEPCIARRFDRTPYTSRMSGDPFPRIALPVRLEGFLKKEDRPAAEQLFLSFSLK